MNFMLLWSLLVVVECNIPLNRGIRSADSQSEENYSNRLLGPETTSQRYTSNSNSNNKTTETPISDVSYDDKGLNLLRNKRRVSSDLESTDRYVNINQDGVLVINTSKYLSGPEELSTLNKQLEENTSKSEIHQTTGLFSMPRNNFHNEAALRLGKNTNGECVRKEYPAFELKSNEPYDDSNNRFPSGVRFVTQKHQESKSDSDNKYDQREGRTSAFLPHNTRRATLGSGYFQGSLPSRIAEKFNIDYSESRDKFFANYFRNKYQNEHSHNHHHGSHYTTRSTPFYITETPEPFRRQRRIIYYTTMPEVYRTLPNTELEKNLNSHKTDNHKVYEKGHHLPSTMKVSTDVNIQTPRKNPESRTYSRQDRTKHVYE